MNLFAAGVSEYVDPASRLAYDVREFVRKGIDLEAAAAEPEESTFWKALHDLGSEPWLDSGDLDAINPLWNREFRGLTTNNTLLNNEVQKGAYDDLIAESSKLLSELAPDHRVRETALILNARHGLRLVERFRSRVSVELHTDVAHDHEASMAYARRLHAICPDFFVIKVPFTPAGLIATRTLRAEGIPVNMTLGFSARQNYLATALANPSYVNVFLGRLNAYVADNGLGDGRLVGEKATLASQREVKVFALGLPQSETRQIAASLRDAEQLTHLAGVDVITMPPGVAARAQETLGRHWTSRLEEEYPVSLAADVDAPAIRLDVLWSVADETRKFVERMILRPAQTPEGLVEAAGEHGLRDVFPELSQQELSEVARQGKIPKHESWGNKIMQGELAIDSLLTFAGLAHFAASQAELDERIRSQLG